MIQSQQDIRAAVRYFKKNAETYGIDTNNIILAGFETVAVSCVTAAYLNNSSSNTSQISDIISSVGGNEGSSDNNGFSSKVKGVISMNGGIYHKEWITPNGPPFLAYHSLQNNTILIDYGSAPANGIFFSIDGDRMCYNYAISQGIPAVLIVSSGNSNYSKYDATNYMRWITKALPIF